MSGYTIASKGRPAEIMLVEDNIGDVILMRKALEMTGVSCNVTVASDGTEALDRLFRRGEHAKGVLPDLILLDVNLPRISGIEVLQKIRQDTGLCSIPVIVMSSSRAQRDIGQCYANGANAYILKPDSMEKLQETTRSINLFWFNQALYIDHE